MEDANDMTVIGMGTQIKGELTFEHPVRIQGQVEGKVSAKGDLQIAEGAVCRAEIDAKTVKVDGTVEGNIKATECVYLNANACLKGDLIAGRLITAEGARIFGNVKVGGELDHSMPAAPNLVTAATIGVDDP